MLDDSQYFELQDCSSVSHFTRLDRR